MRTPRRKEKLTCHGVRHAGWQSFRRIAGIAPNQTAPSRLGLNGASPWASEWGYFEGGASVFRHGKRRNFPICALTCLQCLCDQQSVQPPMWTVSVPATD